MRKTLLFLICLNAFLMKAQDSFDAQILVKNFNELGISNAEVQLYDTNGIFVSKGITDLEGQFIMNMKPGKYHIKLYQEGNLKKERVINLPVLEGRRIYNRVRIFVLYEERKQFTLENLLFEYNSANIEATSFYILDKLVDYLKNEENSKFEIAGHTDNVGSDKDNQVLSESRAKAVIVYLVEQGIDEKRLVPKGYGESVPVADNATDDGRAQNRRTEVKKLE